MHTILDWTFNKNLCNLLLLLKFQIFCFVLFFLEYTSPQWTSLTYRFFSSIEFFISSGFFRTWSNIRFHCISFYLIYFLRMLKISQCVFLVMIFSYVLCTFREQSLNYLSVCIPALSWLKIWYLFVLSYILWPSGQRQYGMHLGITSS